MTRTTENEAVAIKPSLPPILHIIVDEHQGLAGFPREIAGGSDLAERIQESYLERGFVVYPNAFSSYAQSAFAIPALINNQQGRAAAGALSWMNGVATTNQNKLLAALAERGYQVRVYGSNYLDFCQDDAVAFCQIYSRNSIQSLVKADLPTLQKFRIILDSFDDGVFWFWIAGMVVDGVKTRLFDWSPAQDPLWQKKAPRLGPLAAFSAIQNLARDIEDGAAGKAFFVHLILPHYSYIFEEDCRITADIDQWLNRTQRPGFNSPNGRKERCKRYFKQIRCLHTALDRVFDALTSTGLYDKTMIIIHGDHGSRIGRIDVNAKTMNQASRQDLIDAYSTLYSVKGPNQVGGINLETRSVQDLFGEQFMGAAAMPENVLYLRDEAGSRRATDLSKPLGTIAPPPGLPQAQ